MLLWGYALLFGSFLLFVFGLYGALFSFSMPWTGVTVRLINSSLQAEKAKRGAQVFDAIKRDEHYKYLVPLTVPVTLVAVITNWGAFKHWRHASD